jgi:hypothetical protein
MTNSLENSYEHRKQSFLRTREWKKILFLSLLEILSFEELIAGQKERLRSICDIAQLCPCCAFLLVFFVCFM